jgi:arylsulfatase A-like enzyme
MTRRAAIGALAAGSRALSQRRRPNLLFLIADDHAGYVLGAAGNKLAETPNLDRLASEGTRFERHFCNSPVCTPSRQSLLTGQLPHAAGVTVLRTALKEGKPTIARQLQRAGYRTAVFGKMHFNQPSRNGMHGFEHAMCEDAVQREWSKLVPAAVPEARVKPQWRPFRDPARIWLNADKLPYGRYDQDMKSSFVTREAGKFLEENRDRPFALWVSFQEPHSPFDFPLEDARRFDPAKFTVPRVGPKDALQVPLIFRELSDADKQGIAAAYYTSVTFLDRSVGRVLERLRALGLEENTLVVYLADHGYSLGQHGRFEKHCGYDPALHVPLILRWPGRVRHGVAKDMTEHVDVAPTLLDLLGVDALPAPHGRSLRAYVEGRRPPVRRDHVFSEYLENEEAFVRTDRWKYIFCSGRRARTDGYETDNPRPGRYERLFDLSSDPGEFEDVSGREKKERERMASLLLERLRATHPEAENEPPRVSREEAIEWYLRPRDAV